MKKLLKGDTAPKREMDVTGDKVTVTATVRQRNDGPRYAVKWVFDYSNVSAEDTKKLATRSTLIDAQRQFRDTPEKEIGTLFADGSVFDVADMLRRERDPMAGVKRQLSGLKTEREKMAKLKELGIL